MMVTHPTRGTHGLPTVVPFLITVGLSVACFATAAAADVDAYLRQVKPILQARCYACHGALKQEAGLRVDTGQRILAGADSGAIVQPGSPDDSPMVHRVSAHDESERMPPEGKPLSVAEIDTIRRWIADGAAVPENEVAEPDPREHWAFRPPHRPALSDEPTGQSRRNPIDRLIESRRSAQGLQPLGAVPRSLLLRRVYLDLIGLPPTPAELDAFCRDDTAGAYERVVERLLDSPQYGERWARHWMDVWRYTDWYGLGDQLRNSQKHIWHWRDWIVESLNADKGYDQMILEMLAGDELAPSDPLTLRATGFLARNYYLFNRTTWLDDTLEHTSKAFLGLTLNCTKCHDHKYDPIRQQDYYALRAVFEPHQVRLDAVAGETDLERDGIPRAFDAHPDAVTHLHRRGDEKQPDTSRAILPNVPQFLAQLPFDPQLVVLPWQSVRPDLQAFVWRDHLRQAAEQAEQARTEVAALRQQATAATSAGDAQSAATAGADAALRQSELRAAEARLRAASLRIAMLSAAHAAELARQQSDSDCGAAVADAARAARQFELADAQWKLAQAESQSLQPTAAEGADKRVEEARQRVAECEKRLADPGTEYPLPRASLKALEGPDQGESSRLAAYPATSTGRRTALARWIIHPDHPLTARVAVNHLWLRHFGQALVEPVDDFGRRTPAPLQQPLLDWLAVELIESGWRMKHLHRLIVTSDTYRLACAESTADAATEAADRENRFYWCRRPLRMQSEVVRDSLLYLAGALDLRQGGPTVDPRRDEPPYRRSLYFTHSRDDQHPLLSMFDDADILQCYRRQESVVPQQALALANSRLALTMAEQIARRVESSDGSGKPEALSDHEFIQGVFRTLLCREPTTDEVDACQQSLQQWRQLADPAAAERARANLTHALLNHNDFITIR